MRGKAVLSPQSGPRPRKGPFKGPPPKPPLEKNSSTSRRKAPPDVAVFPGPGAGAASGLLLRHVLEPGTSGLSWGSVPHRLGSRGRQPGPLGSAGRPPSAATGAAALTREGQRGRAGGTGGVGGLDSPRMPGFLAVSTRPDPSGHAQPDPLAIFSRAQEGQRGSEERHWLPPKASGEEKVDKEMAASGRSAKGSKPKGAGGRGRPQGGLGRKEGGRCQRHCQLEERPDAGGGARVWWLGVVQGLPGCRGDPASFGKGGLLAEH